jgi:2-keto-4-pentenoate hydratase/2-oxohepta-3-ene-1,7-dioic acid hydratase in catechol pathway
MKFATYRAGNELILGALDAERGVLDLNAAAARLGEKLPARTMVELIEAGEPGLAVARRVLESAKAHADLWTPLARAVLAAPIPRPGKNVFCVGRNYKFHIAEMARSFGREPSYPKMPEFFSKPPTTVIGPEEGIERHAEHTDRLDYEVELAAIIGKRGRNISEADALDYVFGYTVLNDITARDAQVNHHQFFKGKSFDTFCPMGPHIVTKDEYGDWSGRRLTLKVNGQTRQDSSTADMLFGLPRLIESLSAALTLEPGDIIATGTPHGVAQGMKPPVWLQTGDVVEAEVEAIGVLRNRVI